ncbi:MAG: serine/threonine protein kinase [Clostridiaceae bacterium]|nr:serine/threonine protein kinase [Clostridiaceae bacterium]
MDTSQILDNKYKIIEVIGYGGTSKVYLAENIVLGNMWAIKAVPKNSSWYLDGMNEIQALKHLSHPMLPRIADYIEDENASYIVMDYFPGVNLLDYIRDKGSIPQNQLIQWTGELIDVLNYLHSQQPAIIYRDMKPGNIIVGSDNRLRLIDLGTVRYKREEKIEDTIYIGTQGYAAPEQYGTGLSDERTDYYNLGMTLVHMATGVHPANLVGGNIKDALKKSGISKKFLDFMLKLINPDPDKRPYNSDELIKLFEYAAQNNKTLFFQYNRIAPKTLKATIAVSSLIPNSGVTSFCIMLGVYFKRQGYRTALAEYGGSGDFEKLRCEFNRLFRLDYCNDSTFEAEGLIFYPNIKDSSHLSRKGVDIIVQDMGALKNERVIREFGRADIKLIICPSVFWKFWLIENFERSAESYINKDWIYVVNSGDKTIEQAIRKKYGIDNIITFPYVHNIFNFSGEEEKKFRRVIDRLIQQ